MLVWDDVRDRLPDVLLSIGTGYEGDESASVTVKSESRSRRVSSFLPKRLLKTAADRIEDALNCRRIWEEFLGENPHLQSHDCDDARRRYVRINPDLKQKVPKLDEVDELTVTALESAAAAYMANNRPKMREMAHRLIASSFFFEKDPRSVKDAEHGFVCRGKVKEALSVTS